LELFQWSKSWDEVMDPSIRTRIEDELAHILLYVIRFADKAGIDLEPIAEKEDHRERCEVSSGKISRLGSQIRRIEMPRRGLRLDASRGRGDTAACIAYPLDAMYACSGFIVCMLLWSVRGQWPKKHSRKSFYIDPATLRRAKRVLRVRTDAEAIRLSLERVAEMEQFWQFMTKSRGLLKRGSLGVA
jgi:hypothetical protein